jgi:hypothetical protein
VRLAIVITNTKLVYRIVDRTRIQLAGDRSISQEIFNPGLAGASLCTRKLRDFQAPGLIFQKF